MRNPAILIAPMAVALLLGAAVSAMAAQAASAAPKAVKVEPSPQEPSPQEIVDASPSSAWVTVPPEDLVIMTLADGSVIDYQLAPEFAPVHVTNIRQLVRTGYFDGASLLRVQDNYVVQWGRPDEDTTVPKGIVTLPPAEYETTNKTLKFSPLPYRDAYAAEVGYVKSWPVAGDGDARWLVHCYGMIGVARDLAPDTGSGTQLYTVMGHAPRHLDRNLAVVGRILSGMEFLTNRPRGTEALGFYKDDSARLKIVSARIASDLPEAERPVFEVLDSDSPTFGAWVKARANRTGAFFARSAGAVDLCNALPPVRKVP